jgi:hypothetical protein
MWIPNVVISHLIGQVGQDLKLAITISKACVSISGPSAESNTTHKATIHGTSEEIGMTLVVMGKWIAQQQVCHESDVPPFSFSSLLYRLTCNGHPIQQIPFIQAQHPPNRTGAIDYAHVWQLQPIPLDALTPPAGDPTLQSTYDLPPL